MFLWLQTSLTHIIVPMSMCDVEIDKIHQHPTKVKHGDRKTIAFRRCKAVSSAAVKGRKQSERESASGVRVFGERPCLRLCLVTVLGCAFECESVRVEENP